MRKAIFRSLVGLCVVLGGLVGYGLTHPESAFSAFAPCTVASVACFYKIVDTGGTNVAGVNASGQVAIQALPTGANTIGAVTQASGPWAGNTTQFGGSNIATGTGAGGAGIPRVTVSNDSSLAANQSVNVNQIGGTAVVADPCQAIAKTYKPISITANTQIITGTAAKQTYICSIQLGPLGTATNVALVEGTGTTCATSTAGMAGGATAATGWNFPTGGGIAYGDGYGAVAATATLADNVCLFVSAANQVSGVLTWVQK